jgi:hypothetical protein
MLVLVWLIVGLLVGLFVVRRSVALGLSVALWAMSVATIAAWAGSPFAFGADSVGVFLPLIATLLGTWLGGYVLARRAAGAGQTG